MKQKMQKTFSILCTYGIINKNNWSLRDLLHKENKRKQIYSQIDQKNKYSKSVKTVTTKIKLTKGRFF